MLRFKKISLTLLSTSLLVATSSLAVVVTKPQLALAGHCSWYVPTFLCHGPQKVPISPPSGPSVIRINGVAEECGAAEYQCGTFEADVVISDKFSNEQREIITEAAKIMSSRMLTKRILDCTYRNADKDFTGKDKFGYGTDREHLSRMLYAAVLRDGYEGGPGWDKVGDIYVDYFEKDYTPGQTFTLGQAIIDYFASSSSYEAYHKNDSRRWHGRMEINAKPIGSNLPIDKSNASALAGTMAHELLHNVGWDHPQGYPGTVIKEYGLCISRNGDDKSFNFSSAPETDVLNLIED